VVYTSYCIPFGAGTGVTALLFLDADLECQAGTLHSSSDNFSLILHSS